LENDLPILNYRGRKARQLSNTQGIKGVIKFNILSKTQSSKEKKVCHNPKGKHVQISLSIPLRTKRT
jgi:hypothetical protein